MRRTTVIEIDELTAAQGHRALAGQACALADAMADAKEALARGENATWRVAVGPRSVYAIESVHRLAADARISVHFDALASLGGSENVFFDDYVRYRLPISRGERAARFADEWTAAGGEALSAVLGLLRPTRSPAAEPERLNSIVIIGAYGGDHIGDAAILGGTLLGLHKRYGITRATVMSGRPDHTRKLVNGLSTPVEIDVAAYIAGDVDGALAAADALVLGGGPFYDSPRILARHLAATASARRRGLPFIVERIGVASAHFRNAATRWVGRRILESASRISVRTSDSSSHPIMGSFAAEVGRDPAFDYLEQHKALDRLPEAEAAAVDALLADTDHSLKIGINLRPTSDRWRDLFDLSQDTVDPDYMMKLAEALTAFARASKRPVTFIFFPMNAIQFGMSDLSAAYELQRAVKGAIDLRVWEADASLDGVVHLLRRLDAAVAMRFHASIFAVTQNLPLIGLDYFAGSGGKVSELLSDLGRPEDASTVGKFTAEWLVDRLTAATSAR